MGGTDLSDALGDMWRSVLLFVPTVFAFVAILLIGYLCARLIRTVVQRSLKRVGFDRAVERSGFGRALHGVELTPSDLCAKIAFYAVMLFALQLAFGLWGPNPVSDLLTLVIAWLPRAFVAIVIVVVAASIAAAVRDLVGAALGGLPYGRLLSRVASVFILGLGVIAALDQVGIATAVTGPVLIAVLATIAGVTIVGVGGGLVRPMQRRWDVWLDRAGTESQLIREHARAYAETRAAELAAQARARAAEQARIEAEQARIEAERVARERAAEQARIEAERAAEQARTEAERLARERAAEQARIEAEYAARERAAERARMAAHTQAAADARAAEQAREATRREAERAAADRLAAERAAAARSAAESERTQVIAVQAQPSDADRTGVVPGVDEPAPDRADRDRADRDRADFVPGFDLDDDGDRTTALDDPTQAINPKRAGNG